MFQDIVMTLSTNPLIKVGGRCCQYAEDRMHCKFVIVNKFIVKQLCIESSLVSTVEKQHSCFFDRKKIPGLQFIQLETSFLVLVLIFAQYILSAVSSYLSIYLQ
jgi:hypothetical protein